MRGTDHLTAVRYAGLGGSALLAAGAYLAGALPGAGPESGVRTGLLASSPRYATGVAAAVLGLALLAAAWWWLGRHRPPSLRWLLTTGVLWALPLLAAPPLASRDVYAYACQGWLWSGGGDPYATGVSAGGCPWLDAVPPIWRDTPAPYGPLAILVSGLAVWITSPLPDAGRLLAVVGLLRLAALGGAALVAWQGARLARACGVLPAAATWLAVVTPLAALHVASGAHHDALIAGLLVAALAVAARRRPYAIVIAGALVGLAAGVKVTAAVALPFAALLTANGRTRALAAGAAAAGAAFAAVTLAAGLDLGWVRALSGTSELKQWTSPPTALGMAVGYPLRALGWEGGYDAAVAAARIAGLVALAVVLVVLWVRAARAGGVARRIVACCGWALAAVVLLAPVLYPWYLLVPVAVLALAVPEDRRHWIAVAVAVAGFLVFPDGLGVAVLTKFPGAVAVTALAVWAAIRWRRAAAPAPPGPGP